MDKFNLAVQYWLSPKTGKIGRLCERFQYKEHPGERGRDYGVIEWNVPAPPDTFSLVPPAGYKLENTKETAKPMRRPGMFYYGGASYQRFHLSCQPAFVLPDGSVILSWRAGASWDSGGAMFGRPGWQTVLRKLLAELSPGGALPKLPMAIDELTVVGAESDVTYTGFHLAKTVRKGFLGSIRNGRFCEWAIYVPNGAPPARGAMSHFRGVIKYNLPPKAETQGPHITQSIN